jgi:hypothetical protein
VRPMHRNLWPQAPTVEISEISLATRDSGVTNRSSELATAKRLLDQPDRAPDLEQAGPLAAPTFANRAFDGLGRQKHPRARLVACLGDFRARWVAWMHGLGVQGAGEPGQHDRVTP